MMRFLIIASAVFINISYATRNVFVSSPFDNFRVECSKRSAAVEIAVSMVQSAGGKRQDIVFEMACENVDELYPWVNMPEGIREKEKEDCHYSSMFDPILDTKTDYSCSPREYVAGIARLTDTRIQIMCCSLRSRIEFNCQEFNFNKPLNTDRAIIEHENQVVNAMRIDKDGIVVRFCDLAPRSYEDVMIDYKTTEEKKAQLKSKKSSTTTQVKKTTQPMSTTTERSRTLIYSRKQQENNNLKNRENNQFGVTKMLQNEEASGHVKLTKPITTTTTTSTTTTTPPTTTTTYTSTKAATTTTTTATTTTTTEATTTTSTTATPETTPATTTVTTTPPSILETPEIANVIRPEETSNEIQASKQSDNAVDNIDTTAYPVRSEFAKVTFDNNEFPSMTQKNRKKIKQEKLIISPKHQNSDSSEFIFIHPINSNARRRAPVRPYISLWSSEEEEIDESQFATPRREKIKVVRRVVSTKSGMNESKDEAEASKITGKEQNDNARDIDEETAKSPFDLGKTEGINVDSLIGSGPMLEDILRGNREDFINERSNGLSGVEEPKEVKEENEEAQPKQLEEIQLEQHEVDETTTQTPLMIFENVSTTVKPYNAAHFYHTIKRKVIVKEKYLTFCTKDVALRDERNMVLACGMENDIWQPKRCPEGTDCFHSKDSTFRICCPVARG